MSDMKIPAGEVEEKFSLPLFLFTVAVSLAGLVGLFWLLAPASVWRAQVGATALAFAAAFLVVHLGTCFMEYVFHRYVLHKPVVPFLSRFYRQHTLHHSLTRIGKRYTASGREVPFVENVYPVVTPEQGEASFFPWYTLVAFAAIVTPFLALLQWIFPALPWFFGGFAALAFAMALYEIFHAIEHWSFERWAPLIEHPTFGGFWRKVYSFHLRHHAVIDCNEAISGFFTLPVFDWVFGTFILPKTLYTDGSEWKATEFTSPRPCALIRWCDAQSDARVKSRRAAAQAAPAPALVYSRGEQIAHTVTHTAGLLAGLAALVLLVVFAALRGDDGHVAGALVFGLTVVGLYAGLIHRRRLGATWRETLSPFQHAAAFLVIAGTATPFCLGQLRGAWGWSLLGTVWALALLGATARLVWPARHRLLVRVAYLGLAATALVAVQPLVATTPQGALWLILAGALCYATGAVFHVWQNLRYHQVARHAFALGGTTCHLLAVVLFVLPHGL